jgi:hypothetical protein
MKRLISLLLFITLCCAVQASARMNAYIAGSCSSAAATCSTANDKKLWNPTTQPGTTGSDVPWKATKFTLAAQKTITLYKVEECDDSYDTGNGRTVIMNHDSANDQPDETSEVANSAVTLANSAMSACGSWVLEDYVLSATITLAAGTYWLVSQEQNGSDIDVMYESSAGNRVCYSSDSGAIWTCIADYTYNMEVWGCD